MELLLQDTYTILNYNPINKLSDELQKMLKTWKQQGLISDSTYNFLNSMNPTLPRAYAMLKIHKPGNPLRIIISFLDSSVTQSRFLFT